MKEKVNEEVLNEKQQLKLEKKKKRRKIGRRILLGIIAVIALFIAITSLITALGNKSNLKKIATIEKVKYENQLVPEKDEKGNWTFTSDEDLKVIQLTDIHIGAGWLSLKKDLMAINAVATMLTAEKPDLVIVTGDIAYPVPFQAGTMNNKSAAKIFADLMEQLGVYWTLGYGNHDTEAYSRYTREEISDFYGSGAYKYCLFRKGPDDVDGYGNQVINIKKTNNIITQSLYILDSHSYTGGDIFGIFWKYDNIHQNQVNWYIKNVKAYNEINKKTAEELGLIDFDPAIRSSMFFHIPLVEMKDAITEYANNDFKDTDNVEFIYGAAGESGKVVFCGIGEDTMFETIRELGSTKAIFNGHDHLNTLSLKYKGIQLTYGMSIDYLAYIGISEKGFQRGCTVITYKPDGSYEITPENYYQDKYVPIFEREKVTMDKPTMVVPEQ